MPYHGEQTWRDWEDVTLSLGYTGGLENDVATKSLGGTLSYCPVYYAGIIFGLNHPSISYENVFDSVTIAEKSSGYICYRGLYLGNFNGGSSLLATCSDVKVWIESNISAPNDHIYIGTDSVGVRYNASADMIGYNHPFWDTYPATMSSISNETTAPAGITWRDTGYTLSIGTLRRTAWVAIWLKHSTSVGASAYRTADFKIGISSDVI